MDSIEVMQAENAINAYLETVQQVLEYAGYDQEAVSNLMGVLDIAKISHIASVQVASRMQFLLNRNNPEAGA